MSDLLTLILDVGKTVAPRPLPTGYSVRELRSKDAEELGRLYFASYDPGLASADVEEAIGDIRATFGGAYGDPWEEASLAATSGGDVVAAVLTVHRAPWDDTPRCPFVVEIFTDRAHRRRGVASHLLERCLAEVAAHEEARALALRVRSTNEAALALYSAFGFRRWGTAAPG